MAETEVSARGWTYEINTGTSGSPVWVEILGIVDVSHKPGSGKADATNNKDAGSPRHRRQSRSHEWTLKGNYLEDPDNGDRDPGQEACETLAAAVDIDSLGQFRFTSPGGSVRTFDATCEVTHSPGKEDGFTSWECMVEQSGLAVLS